MENLILQDIQNQKELTVFFNVLNSLPDNIKREKKAKSDEKIPVILSSDDNYSCFVATTGMSILRNTNSFIDFYILSDGITDESKKLIQKSYESVTSDFSLTFVECDSEKVFSSIKLAEDYHVKLNTCNRLLIPKLLPKIKRAIYLDVDLIVLDDIKKLWDEKLNGHVFGCTPLYYDRFSTVQFLRNNAQISEDAPYWYFNSGVMLIDYNQWRKIKGNNDMIIKDLMSILSKVNVLVTPDEVILNKFAYENGGYQVLPLKYNTHTDYTYKFLKKNFKILSNPDKCTLDEFNKHLEFSKFDEKLLEYKKPVIHHFFGHEKPWLYASAAHFPIAFHEHFEDFWFYAKHSMFFEKIKRMFIVKHMYVDYSMYTCCSKQSQCTCSVFTIKRKYIEHRFLSHITFGKFSKRQKQCAKNYKNLLK